MFPNLDTLLYLISAHPIGMVSGYWQGIVIGTGKLGLGSLVCRFCGKGRKCAMSIYSLKLCFIVSYEFGVF